MGDWYDHDRDDWRSRCDAGLVASRKYADRLPPKHREPWPDFGDYLLSRDLSPHIARANLWYPSHAAGDDVPRIVMPATSGQEGNFFWQARSMTTMEPRFQSPHGVCSGDAVIVVYPFGLTYEAQAGFPEWTEAAVVEGPMCALAVAGTGRLGIATMGADPPEERLDNIVRLVKGVPCFVIPDNDRVEAFVRVFMYLTNRGIKCRMQPVRGAKDFAELSLGNRLRFF